MKGLFAVLALALALGAGYWKWQNPEGNIEVAKSQAQAVISRVGAGIDTIKSGAPAVAAAKPTDDVELKLTDAENRLANLEDQIKLGATETGTRLDTIEESLAAASAGESTELVVLGDTLKAQIATAQGQLEETQTLLSDTHSQLKDTKTQLEDTQSQLAESKERLANLEQTIGSTPDITSAEIDEKLQSLEATLQQQLAQINESVTSLDKKQNESNSDNTVGLVTEKVGALEQRLNTLAKISASTPSEENENALAEVAVQIDQRMAAMEDRIAAATAEDTRGTIEALQSQLDTANKKFEDLEAQQVTSSSDIGGSLAVLQSDLGSVRSDISDLQSALESSVIENQQNDLQQKLKELEATVRNAPPTDLSSLTNALDSSRDRIQSLEKRVTDLPASTEANAAKQVQDALQEQIAALEGRLADSASQPDERIVSTLTQVQQKVSELESRKYVTPEELQKLSETKSIQYKIYFDVGKTQISPAAAKVLDSFIAQETNRATAVSVYGTTDSSGSSEFNQQLALSRANQVRSYLIQRGFDFTKIKAVDGIGEDLAAAQSADGETDANQRSVILFAYQP